MWRKGPAGKNTLCNRCGIKWSRIQNPRKKVKRANGTKAEYKNGVDGSLSEGSPLVQPLISPSNSDKEDSYDVTDEQKTSPVVHNVVANEKEGLSTSSRKIRKSSDDSSPEFTRSSSRPKTTKRKASSLPSKRISNRSKRNRKPSIRDIGSEDEQDSTPSVFELLQKIREANIVPDFPIPDLPLEPRQQRFFDHAKQELQRAEQGWI